MPQEKTPPNSTMLQAFEWYVPADQQHWKRLAAAVPGLKAIGVDNVWIPPACKASTPEGNGYDIYDLYDLGEFEQKGSKATKWGSKEDLMALVAKAKETGVGLYFDAVLNHKAAADQKEKCMAIEVDPDDRLKDVSEEYEIEGWLGFDFPGRGEKYSKQKYHWYHFSGTDYNAANEKTAIYRITGDGKYWSKSVDKEKGNFDFLMFADLDYSHQEVKDDVKNWGEWVGKELGLKGFRFDAIKHYSENFLQEFVENLDKKLGTGWFLVGEFWKDSLEDMHKYLDRMQHKFSLFDAPLVYNFSQISTSENADLRKVFDDTLVQTKPINAVTLVMNHDTQPHQALAAPITPWFLPLAYSLILLRPSGYPCLFHGDLYGLHGPSPAPPSCGGRLPVLVNARARFAYGAQHDYFDAANCVGWTREGTWDRPCGLACVMSNAGPGEKRMYVGEGHAGEVWTDVLGWEQGTVTIGEDGHGVFRCPGISVAVWVKEGAEGRDGGEGFDAEFYK